MKTRFRILTTLIAAALFLRAPTFAAEPLLDNWEIASRATTLLLNGRAAFDPPKATQQGSYNNRKIVLDYARHKVGAFSIGPAGDSAAQAEGFCFRLGGTLLPAPVAGAIDVSGWLFSAPAGPLHVALLTAQGQALGREEAAVESGDGEGWRRFSAHVPLAAEKIPASAMLAIQWTTRGNTPVRIDGVEIRAGERVQGITDRRLEDWMESAKLTRADRMRSAIEAGTATDFSGRDRQIFDQLWLGKDITRNNAELRQLYRKTLEEHNTWHLTTKMRLIQAYHELGHRSRFKPARLESETETLLLEVLWEFTKGTNDIATTRQSTWWLTGSENHDLNAKVSALVSSRIFMDEPAYRDRIYPDLGRGPGVGYWQHVAVGDTGPSGDGNFKDGREYRAKDHHEAWVKFFHRYFSERATHGFFLENASLVYMKWTLNFVHALHAYCDDPALKKETGRFLDLVWADWAQSQIAGVRGGPATRNQHSVGGYDSMTTFARFYLGGVGTTGHLYSQQLFDDYAWPAVVWDLALDTQGRGSYAIVQQGVGEEDPVRPRPAGLEQTLLINPESRMVKSSWVTPDYILGTQMDHPDAVHSHLSTVGRWQGLICAGDPAARIVTTSSATADGKADTEIMYQSVHAGASLVTQQSRGWKQINPNWFPARAIYQKPTAIFIGKAWDAIVEQGGWVFVAKGNAYGAVRVLEGRRDDTKRIVAFDTAADLPVEGNPRLVQLAEQPWQWAADRATIIPQNIFSPIVIEAGRRADYGSFEAFQKAVAGAKVELLKTVVTGYYLVSYKGPAKNARELFLNAATSDLPLIDGQPVAYRLARTFESPFLQSARDGAIMIRKGEREHVLFFTSAMPPR